jgi:hypothetical protein
MEFVVQELAVHKSTKTTQLQLAVSTKLRRKDDDQEYIAEKLAYALRCIGPQRDSRYFLFERSRFNEVGMKYKVPGLAESPNRSATCRLLLAFALLVFLLVLATVVHYWVLVSSNVDLLCYGAWLVVSMVAGMFVQVLAGNYKCGRPLLYGELSRFIFPLMFSLIVYYPVWAIAASAPRTMFAFYAAFLNGYFWENVVSSARLPVPIRNPRD